MDDRALIHRLALAMLKGIGPVNARNLVAYCGGVDALFTDPKARQALEKVPGIGPERTKAILNTKVLAAAEKELAYVQKHKLRMLFYLDEDY
ncbi:MAG TPA: helix-hairpin-helix domain-containing protein, partial [Flavobacteriales bacterium]|nr:helix-hairpin-helix domain-containing protein [Flavobacteriales bacterium]